LITPSEADIKITRKLVDAGKLLEIAVLDHIIVGQDQFYSFADEGGL
jgi:DNA repair protein RadC